jgi:hypothetical protein
VRNRSWITYFVVSRARLHWLHTIMTKGDNPYDILGVPRSASEADIKAAYRKAAKKYHPDKQLTERNRERASAIFPRIHDAYETLTSDTTERRPSVAASPVVTKPKKRMNPPPDSPSTRTIRGTSASQKKQSVPSTPVWRKKEGTHPARSHRRSASSPMAPPLSVKKSPGASPGSPGTLRGKHRRSSIALPTPPPLPPMDSPSGVSQRKRVSGVPQLSPRALPGSPGTLRGKHRRSSIALPTPPPQPPMDSPSGVSQRKRVSGVPPPSPRSASPSTPGASTLKRHLIPRKMQIKPATAPAPPQNAIQRLSVKLSQSRKEKKAEKKERQERLLQ